MSIKTLFEDIADAIREKSGSSDTYTPAEMPSAIRSIPSGSSTASGVSYDNTSSGLTASNVQDAVDELAGDVSTINSDLSELEGVIPSQNPWYVSTYNLSCRNGVANLYLMTNGVPYVSGNNTTICRLPEGFRPKNNRIVYVPISNAGTGKVICWGAFLVLTSGYIQEGILDSTGNYGVAYLDISYPVS